MKQSKSTSNLQLLITELSDSETSNSESITQPNLTRKTADIFNRIKSRHVSSNTLIKQQSIQTQLSKSDMNIEKISTKSTKTPNIQYLISCLDSSTESDVPSTPIHKSKTPQLSHNLAYFLRVRNIEPDLHKITFQKKSRSIGPKKVNSSKISNAFVMELPATPRENLFNIESINCIKEGPIYSKPISNESNNSINYISYSKPPLVNKSDLQLIDNSKISSAVQTSRSSKFREVAEYIENVNSTVYYLRSDSFYAPRTPDGLIVLKIGKKPEWTNFLGKINLIFRYNRPKLKQIFNLIYFK